MKTHPFVKQLKEVGKEGVRARVVMWGKLGLKSFEAPLILNRIMDTEVIEYRDRVGIRLYLDPEVNRMKGFLSSKMPILLKGLDRYAQKMKLERFGSCLTETYFEESTVEMWIKTPEPGVIHQIRDDFAVIGKGVDLFVKHNGI